MNDALDRIGAARVVPVLTVADADEAEKACRALVAGGLPVVEITFRTDAAAEAIRRAAAIDGLLVGAGSILSPEQLGVALEAGAQFAVAPGTSAEVVEAARSAGVPFVPGVATPSEIERGRALGCRVLKVFPASARRRPSTRPTTPTRARSGSRSPRTTTTRAAARSTRSSRTWREMNESRRAGLSRWWYR